MAVDALPAVTGGAGGLIGGLGGTAFGFGFGGIPGGVGGAALGGAAGEAAKQLINRMRGVEAPATAGEAAMNIGREGLVQGGSELLGGAAMKGGKMAAHGLMDMAISPAPTLAKEFTTAAGDIADTALREKLPVGNIMPGTRKGSNMAQQALRESAGATRQLLTDAGAAGTTFDAQTVARGPVTQLVGDIARQPLSTSELNHIADMFTEYSGNHNTMTPAMLKDMKQAAQRIAKPIFKALNQGNVVPAGESLKAQFNKAIADGAKDALETIPGVGASEARTQTLIGANKAIRQAEVRRLPLMAENRGADCGCRGWRDCRGERRRTHQGIGRSRRHGPAVQVADVAAIHVPYRVGLDAR
jgi:hypothetical protein